MNEPASTERPTNTISVIAISLVIGALSGALAAGGLFYIALNQPSMIQKLQPLSDFIMELRTDSTDKDVTQVTLEEDSAVTEAVAEASSAVVSIVGTQRVQSFFFNQILENDFAGTGFVIDRDEGLILTNRHVVDEEAEFRLITNQGVEVEFSEDDIYLDPLNDLAIIKADLPSDLEIGEITLGDSSTLIPGQKVIAIGNALGKFDTTVTVGVVSALGRQIEAGNMFGTSQETLLDVIQTDAAINQGNSGGPLLNTLGQVIGVNTAVAGQAENIGFAIPIDDAKTAIESYLLHGEILRPWLGISYVQITSDIANANDLPVDYGAYVRAVITDSPASKVDLKEGDIVTQVDDQKLTEDNGLIKTMQNYQVDDVIEITVLRPQDSSSLDTEYEEFTLTVSLEQRQADSN